MSRRVAPVLLPVFAMLVLTGCANIQNLMAKPPFEEVEEAPLAVENEVAPVAEEPAEVASAPPETSGALGTTVASLGDVAQPGFWLKTPLVNTERPGRVQLENGTSVQVQLLPLDAASGAGSEISLSAMRGLGLSLTDLASLEVFAL